MNEDIDIGIVKKVFNGQLTAGSASVIAIVLVLQSFGVIGGRASSDAEMITFRERVSAEHRAALIATQENGRQLANISAEQRRTAEINKELLLMIRDIKEDSRRP